MNVINAHLVLNGESAHRCVVVAARVVVASCNQSIARQDFWLSSQVANFLEVMEIEVVSVELLQLLAIAKVPCEN